MNSDQSIKAKIECPFFKKLIQCSIVCESMVPGGLQNTSLFASNRTRNMYAREYCCCNGGRDCSYNKSIMKSKYDD